ncbi:hypothetical protein BG004_008003 [Podila humilis]|nr:hypothetical protein BG004_008003 [Podila humilis]
MVSAAPVPNSPSDVLDSARDGPYNISVQAGIAGAIFIVAGVLLGFFGYGLFRPTMFLIGFYFFGNISYMGMSNGGVKNTNMLLIISLVVGILGGVLLVCCSRLGVAVLGALALFSLGLWIQGWKAGGLLTSSTHRAILLGVLAALGFIIGFVREREMVIIGSALVGAYSTVIGIDMFAHTGFANQADSFINSKNTIDERVSSLDWKQYALLGGYIVLAILGAIIQFRTWGSRNFRPAQPAAEVVVTEKTSRFVFNRR